MWRAPDGASNIHHFCWEQIPFLPIFSNDHHSSPIFIDNRFLFYHSLQPFEYWINPQPTSANLKKNHWMIYKQFSQTFTNSYLGFILQLIISFGKIHQNHQLKCRIHTVYYVLSDIFFRKFWQEFSHFGTHLFKTSM